MLMIATFEHGAGEMTVAEKIYVEYAYHEASHRELGGVDLIDTVDESPIGFARDWKRRRIADLRHGGRSRGYRVSIDSGFFHNNSFSYVGKVTSGILIIGAIMSCRVKNVISGS